MKIISVKIFRQLGGALVAAVLLLLAACGQPGAAGSDRQPGQLTIVTAFYPFQFVAEHVAGAHAQVTSLTAPGAEPHDLELTPKQVASVTDASLVIYEKSFQAAVDEAVAQSGNPNVLDTATVVPLVPLAQPAGGDDHTAAADGDHESSGLDPHVWLDPVNMITITEAVRDQLVAIDPSHAADYRANADRLDGQLKALDSSYRTGLQNCRLKEFITTHAAFGYLSRRYGLEQVGINGLSPDSEPSPARIAEVQQIARRAPGDHDLLRDPGLPRGRRVDRRRPRVEDRRPGSDRRHHGGVTRNGLPSVMTSNLTALRTANGCS